MRKKNRQTLCLNMIVKNETPVIERCLASVKDLIDYWVIVDTGSTDGTQDMIRQFLKDLPGELIERPWMDFGHNRSEALEYARGKADYLFTIDADEVLTYEDGFSLPPLTADSYLVEFAFGTLAYYRCQFVNNHLDWCYKGVLHEYLFCPQAQTQEIVPGMKIFCFPDGSRSSDPHKFQKDVLVLERALLDEPNNERYVFYLAQSYRDAGNPNMAIEHYRRRAEMGGWSEEVWYSLYQVAELKRLRGDAWPEVLDAYLQAYQYHPTRAEPLYKILTHYLYQQNHLAYLFGQLAIRIPYPQDLLFIEQPIYHYLLPLNYAVVCYWVGDHAEALQLNNLLLQNPLLPPSLFDQVLKNRRFSLDVIYPKQSVTVLRKNKIKVCITFYNPGPFLDNCVDSLLHQDYDNFEMVFIDDASTDGSSERIPTDDPRVTLVRNPENQGTMRNIYTFLTHYCDPDDIYVHVDGDDWLACDDALSYVNRLYNEYDCWVLYGQFQYNDGRYGFSLPYPDPAALAQVRYAWCASHLRTFRAGLFFKIKDQDPDYSCLKNTDGAWFSVACDVALMCSILELAGFDRVRFNDRVLYVYNTENPLSDFRVHSNEYPQANAEISQKKPFEPVDRYL